MKKILILTLIGAVALVQAQTKVKITASYSNPVNSLYIRGDGCGLNWNSGQKLTKIDDNNYSITLTCSGRSQAKVLVDDQDWMIGANHIIDPTDTQTYQIYPWFYTTQGSLKVFKDIYSPELSNSRDVIVYLPPSYNENTLKIHKNVLVMHDGNNLFDPATAFLGNAWMIQNTINPLIYQGKMEEVVVIGAYNTGDRMNEYTYSFDKSESFGGKGDLYLDWIEKELLPLASQNLRITLDKGNRLGILGSSLGGLISCYAGWTRPKVYGRVGCMSSSFWWNNQDFQNTVLPAHSLKSQKPRPKFYMDSGTEGGEASCAQYTMEIEDYMVQTNSYVMGNDVQTFIDRGASHNEYYWGKRFYLPMLFLYPSPTVSNLESKEYQFLQ